MVSRPPFWKAVAPISTRRGGFAFLSCRRVWHERRVMMAAEREPEQFENPFADLLLRVAESLRVGDHQLVSVPRGDALKRMAH